MNIKRRIWIVQQGVWNLRLESMPLAAGYLKAYADADARIAAECDIRIFSLSGGDTTLMMVEKLFFREIPDIVCFSVLGWNYGQFKKIAETFKQYNPDGWVLFGGNHVSHQADRVFAEAWDVDVVVNGEGELTFREILCEYLAGVSKHDLHRVDGVSFRDEEGEVVTTRDRKRIQDLDIIPSPVLSGAIPLLNEHNEFRYDVAFMETNRGCPYQCAFCYWGGAVGQKIRRFSRERLKAELELYGRLGVNDVILCDANFGMLRQDQVFVEDLISVRDEYGFPRNLEASWAKNKSKIFFQIVQDMKEAGLHSNFTLALQSSTDSALKLMKRNNMKVNEWEDLALWLQKMGMECYAELIWGCPGETYDTFIQGYDQLAKYVYRIATYPLLLMPNTDFFNNRDEFEFKTIRGENDDFEYILSHCSMSVEDNRKMLRFLFWARVIAENMVFRSLWWPLRQLDGIMQSEVLLSLDAWLDRQNGQLAQGLKRCRAEVVDNFDLSRVSTGIHFVASEPGLIAFLSEWWKGDFESRISPEHREFMFEVFQYDLATKPIFDGRRQRMVGTSIPSEREEVNGVLYFVRRSQPFRYDVPTLVGAIRAGQRPDLTPAGFSTDLYFKVGFEDCVDNHEFYPQFVGKTREQLNEEAKADSGRISRAVTLDPIRRNARTIVEENLREYRDETLEPGADMRTTESCLLIP